MEAALEEERVHVCR